MRVNVYAEELTDRIEIVDKNGFTGVRFYLELPVALATPPATLGAQTGIAHIKGPFVHKPGDDDSAAVTFWGKRDLRTLLVKALQVLDQHAYNVAAQQRASGEANKPPAKDELQFPISDQAVRDALGLLTRARDHIRGSVLTKEQVTALHNELNLVRIYLGDANR